jgi:hypothetical protein
MNAQKVVTLESLVQNIIAAEQAVKEAPVLGRRAAMDKLRAANAALRVFKYRRKSMNGKAGMIRH